MDTSSPSTLTTFMIVSVVLAIVPILCVRTEARRSRVALVVAALLPTLTLALFYSLAIHMHRSFGGWPESIGTHGFPGRLALHANLAMFSFSWMLLGTLVLVPGLVLCACVPKLRPGVHYIAVYALSTAIAFGVMQLAPEPFLYWWRD
tara:strand:+ start:76 stop:519 length:444 start_codon:yes stop_codon:yes gene_type:complete